MRVFELHFNPKKKQDSVFDSFAYEPESQQESGLGNLYMAGELTKALPQNNAFLDNLSAVIKNDFYVKSDFSEALKEANNFLEKETKSGNVNWLGNLNFAIVNIGNSILNFTKVGDVKILLLRQGEVLDIGQNLELQDQEPYPMKVFSNTASGKLLAQDKIIILSQEIFSAVSQNEDFLNQLSKASREKEIKNVFKLNKELFYEASGLCLLITEVNSPVKSGQTDIGIAFPIKIPVKVILVICLILLLAVAYFLFGDKKVGVFNQSDFEKELQNARSKIAMAENFIIMKKEDKARGLFEEAWSMLLPISESKSPLRAEASSLQESIEKYLDKNNSAAR